MQTTFLNLEDNKINTFSIAFFQGVGNVTIDFFPPGKFANAYAEYSDDIEYNTNDGFLNFNKTVVTNSTSNLYIHLPKEKFYNLLINNSLGTVSLKNGENIKLLIEAAIIYMEDTKATGKIYGNVFHPNSNITLKNSTIDSITGESYNINISNCEIKYLQNDHSIFTINIKNNSVIDNFRNIKTYNANTNIYNSTIKNIDYRKGSLLLEDCNIGNIKCSNNNVIVKKCHFLTPNTIKISKNCRFWFNGSDQFVVKKSLFNKINIYEKENKNKKTTVHLQKGEFIYNKSMHVKARSRI